MGLTVWVFPTDSALQCANSIGEIPGRGLSVTVTDELLPQLVEDLKGISVATIWTAWEHREKPQAFALTVLSSGVLMDSKECTPTGLMTAKCNRKWTRGN